MLLLSHVWYYAHMRKSCEGLISVDMDVEGLVAQELFSHQDRYLASAAHVAYAIWYHRRLQGQLSSKTHKIQLLSFFDILLAYIQNSTRKLEYT